MLSLIVISTLVARGMKRRPAPVFLLSSVFAFLAFIPSCAGIMSLLDARRFGLFHYAEYSEVQDFRVELYLPTAARDITVHKTAMGHRAKYTITEQELRDWIDLQWDKYGDKSESEHTDSLGTKTVDPSETVLHFEDLGWPPLQNAIPFETPRAANGAGASYYFEPATNTAYHRGGYW